MSMAQSFCARQTHENDKAHIPILNQQRVIKLNEFRQKAKKKRIEEEKKQELNNSVSANFSFRIIFVFILLFRVWRYENVVYMNEMTRDKGCMR